MNTVQLEDVAKDLASYVKKVEAGETFIIAARERPVAELRPAPPPHGNGQRPFGLCAGDFVVPDDFDAPLPDDVVADFEGGR